MKKIILCVSVIFFVLLACRHKEIIVDSPEYKEEEDNTYKLILPIILDSLKLAIPEKK